MLYAPVLRSMNNSKVITQAMYDDIVNCLQLYNKIPKSKRTAAMRRYYMKYRLFTNVDNTCLRRANSNGKFVRVATFENMFDIINTIHVNVLGHQRDKDKNRQVIDQHYYGIPKSAIEQYINLCEECVANQTKQPKKIKIH